MTISGVILTLVDAPVPAADAVEWVRRDPRLTLGQQDGRRLAVVAETSGPTEDRRLWHTLREHVGIAHVDITGVFFDEENDVDAPARVPARSASHTTARVATLVHNSQEWNDADAH